MEGQPSFESREAQLDTVLESFAKEQEMDLDELIADMVGFMEINRQSDDVTGYFEMVSEMTGVPVETLLEYAVTKAERVEE